MPETRANAHASQPSNFSRRFTSLHDVRQRHRTKKIAASVTTTKLKQQKTSNTQLATWRGCKLIRRAVPAPSQKLLRKSLNSISKNHPNPLAEFEGKRNLPGSIRMPKLSAGQMALFNMSGLLLLDPEAALNRASCTILKPQNGKVLDL